MEQDVISDVISGINWIWYSFALVAAFAVGALWYSLLWFKKWRDVFKVDMPDQDSPAGWIRSFLVQFVTGGMLGLMCFVLADISLGFAIFAVLTIAGWQACTNTFKYGSWKRFLLSVAIESGYTVAASAVYIGFAFL